MFSLSRLLDFTGEGEMIVRPHSLNNSSENVGTDNLFLDTFETDARIKATLGYLLDIERVLRDRGQPSLVSDHSQNPSLRAKYVENVVDD